MRLFLKFSESVQPKNIIKYNMCVDIFTKYRSFSSLFQLTYCLLSVCNSLYRCYIDSLSLIFILLPRFLLINDFAPICMYVCGQSLCVDRPDSLLNQQNSGFLRQTLVSLARNSLSYCPCTQRSKGTFIALLTAIALTQYSLFFVLFSRLIN